MTAKKRMVWRISTIVRAICEERGTIPRYEAGVLGSYDGAFVLEQCEAGNSAEWVIGRCPHSLPVLLGRPTGYDLEGTAAALVATAKRLRVPMVPA